MPLKIDPASWTCFWFHCMRILLPRSKQRGMKRLNAVWRHTIEAKCKPLMAKKS